MKIMILLTLIVFVILLTVCIAAVIGRAISDAYDRWRQSRLIDNDHEFGGNPL